MEITFYLGEEASKAVTKYWLQRTMCVDPKNKNKTKFFNLLSNLIWTATSPAKV